MGSATKTKTTVNSTMLENVIPSVTVSRKKADVTKERRMVGDTWSKSRSKRLLRQRQKTHTYTCTQTYTPKDHQVTAAL